MTSYGARRGGRTYRGGMTLLDAPAPILDNGNPFVRGQIDQYLATGGAEPVFRFNAPLLLITTQGRKSQQWRRTCLIYGPHEDTFVICASLGGAPAHPVWYLNLLDNPRVWLNVGPDAFWATAREATETERPALWSMMVSLFPDYADYKEKTDRVIPLIVLSRER